jgi:hypothetical protein
MLIRGRNNKLNQVMRKTSKNSLIDAMHMEKIEASELIRVLESLSLHRRNVGSRPSQHIGLRKQNWVVSHHAVGLMFSHQSALK